MKYNQTIKLIVKFMTGHWGALLGLSLLALFVFGHSLHDPFIGDDINQIVDNQVVHSLSNFKNFFDGGTFYNGGSQLVGDYYRPLMTVTNAVLYALFGAHSFAYHLVQLLLCIGTAFLVYMIFAKLFNGRLALLLAAIFLVHPINSQVVFAIPTLQDCLFMFFGMLGLWLVAAHRSYTSLGLAALSILLSLLAKETGLLFVAMTLLYVWLYQKQRLRAVALSSTIPIATWLVLKIHAIGLNNAPHNAPINSFDFLHRMINVPAMAALYVQKFLVPIRLSSAYYWADTRITFSHFALPLVLDILVIAVIVTVLLWFRRKNVDAYKLSLLFTAWFGVGLAIHLQILPLDFTASEPWFYFCSIGILGLIGVAVKYGLDNSLLNRKIFYLGGLTIIIVLSVLSFTRGQDWRSQRFLATKDAQNSRDNFIAYYQLAGYYADKGDYSNAETYAYRSYNTYKNNLNAALLGGVLGQQGEYDKAYQVLADGTKRSSYYVLYENLAILSLYHGTYESNRQLMTSALNRYPHDSTIWLHLAVLYQRNHDNTDAINAVQQAANNGPIPGTIYNGIIKNQSFVINNGPNKIINVN